jgi:hypothetical protein
MFLTYIDNLGSINPAIVPPSHALTDKEKQEAFINQEGYQDMLEEFTSNDFRPPNDFVDTMKFYQTSFFKDLIKLQLKEKLKVRKKLRFFDGNQIKLQFRPQNSY